MRVFVAGATGALGRRLVPALVAAGHEVVGTTRTADRAAVLSAAGAEPVLMNGLDRQAVLDALTKAKPEVVVHQLTALSGAGNARQFDREFAMTNRLRTEGLNHVLAGTRAAGARRIVAQSYTGWTNQRSGGPVKTEDDPLDPAPTAASQQTLAAIRYLESTVSEAPDLQGLALRYGSFYGPGTTLCTGGQHFEMVRKRRFPIVGGGGGIWSLVHIDDAASATVAAVERGGRHLQHRRRRACPRDWLLYLAEVIGARPLLRIPTWIARPLLGEHGISMMTAVHGSSNAKAKRELDWHLRYPSWRDGFRSGLG